MDLRQVSSDDIPPPRPLPGNPVAPSAAVGDRPGCELLRTPRTFPQRVIFLGVNQIKSKALARNSGVFITATAASVAPVVFTFNHFSAHTMAANTLRNIIVVGGSFVGRVSGIGKPTGP